MNINNLIFIIFIGFALYNMGYMISSQMQHFALYAYIEPSNFARYITQNNKLAVLPAVVPGFLAFGLSVLLIWTKPNFVPSWYVYLVVALNIIVIISTFVWQKSLHAELAIIGYDEAKVRLLLNTNWIRTIAYTIQGGATLWLLGELLKRI